MTTGWVTTSSTNVEAVVNSLAAACDQGFVPDELYLIENPAVTAEVAQAVEVAKAIIEAYGGDKPAVHLTTVKSELEFNRIRMHVKDAIEAIQDKDGVVAVDITPGRKFMSAITFAAGLRYEADHVFYFYLKSTAFYGRLYPNLPRTATHLYDFTEDH